MTGSTRWSRILVGPTGLGIVVGLVLGVGGYTFWYGQGASYLTDDPTACANCHVMQAQYDGWLQASHRSVATCNDCHTPHGLVRKYLVKGQNGFWHSFAFTTGRFAEPIRAKPGNKAVTEQRCRDCHLEIAHVVDGVEMREPQACSTCHAGVGHRS